MTPTAMKNKELDQNKRIEEAKLRVKESEGRKDREQRERESKRHARATIGSALGGAAVKAWPAIAALNDPEWYKQYSKSVDLYTNLPTFDRLGDPTLLYKIARYDTEFAVVPGIMVFTYNSTIGNQPVSGLNSNFTNPINQTLTRTMEKVLSLNSRSSVSWGPGDLGFNLMCTADIITGIIELARAIRIYYTYHAANNYFAQHVISALGFNYIDMQAHIAEYRKVYDQLVLKFNSSIVAPADCSLFKRRMYLAGNIFGDFADSEYPRQVYAFNANYLFYLDGSGSSAKASGWSKQNYTQIFTSLFGRITAIADDASFSEMYRDLRHAFGDNIVQLPEFSTWDPITINTDTLNREQIHNLITAPHFVNGSIVVSRTNYSSTTWDLHQDTSGYLYQGDAVAGGWYPRIIRGWKYTFNSSANQKIGVTESKYFIGHDSFNEVLNMHKRDVTGDDILDITRLTFAMFWTEDPDTAISINNLSVSDCGTEVVEKMFVYYLCEDSGAYDITSSEVYTHTFFIDLTSGDEMLIYNWQLGMCSAFDWAPKLTMINTGANATPCVSKHMDACTTFSISGTELTKIHQVCVQSELYIPDKQFTTKFAK